ncbi:type VI secretion system tube protein Hcp [Providencia sp. PROV272]|uniref:type VI secretion system tube protein Hcp n=1 Tax=Providencia sp. PROV272 TaxID=2936800 RepID=UPI003CE7798B
MSGVQTTFGGVCGAKKGGLALHFGLESAVSYKPVVFTKPIDKSSPLLAVTLDENKELEATFVFYRTSQNGHLEKYYKIK